MITNPPVSLRLPSLRLPQAFYRFRLDEFEKERSLHLTRLDSITPQADELHRLRWELTSTSEELLALRKSVSDAQVSVHKEREIANDQTAVIVRLKAQQVEDRKRIQRLLALTQPVTSDITFVTEGSEDAAEGLARQYAQALEEAESSVEVKNTKGDGAALTAKAVASRLAARNESLQQTVDSLMSQLNSYKAIARDKISTLYEDRNIREQQFTKVVEDGNRRVELLTRKLCAAEEGLSAVTKDYLVLRHNAQIAQRVMIEEKQILRSERLALEHDRASAARQMSLEMAAAREASQAEISLATDEFRGQVQARERDMAVLREQYENIQGVYASRVRDLEQRLELSLNKYASLNRRRKLEIQGSNRSAMQAKKEIEALKGRGRATPGGAKRRGGEESPPVVFYSPSDDDDDNENEPPSSGNSNPPQSAEEIAFLKNRVAEMEVQLRRILVRDSEGGGDTI
jgi:coiled-coil domain-containing protein 77